MTVRTRLLWILIGCLMLVWGVYGALAANITAIWDYDAPPDDLAGFRIYYGLNSRDTANPDDLRDPEAGPLRDGPAPYDEYVEVSRDARSVTIVDLERDTVYYFTATAFDEGGNESAYSNEASILIPPVDEPPPPVQLFRIDVVRDDNGEILLQISQPSGEETVLP